MNTMTETTTARADATTAPKKKILVIDDRPRDTNLVKVCLEITNRFDVREENDPFKAIATAEEYHPDLIFMDIIMPGKDGSALAAAIHENPRLQGIPIVFLTALATRDDVQGGSGHLGEYAFLSKPIIPFDLITCLRHHLGQ